LIADGCHGVTRYQPTTDKIMRLNAQTAMIEHGFVYIPETAPWLAIRRTGSGSVGATFQLAANFGDSDRAGSRRRA
jgi:hypothetical protein